MSAYEAYFKDKRITVVGLGLLGRGVGDVAFLAGCGADITVTDLKTEAELAPSLEALKSLRNIHYTLGKHDLNDFQDRDLILCGAGVPFDSPYLAHARSKGVPITMSTALFARFAQKQGATLAGVTGTRGKSTTTYLLDAIARAQGRHTLLGGNILGISTLALLPEVTEDSVIIMELDSWQLQGFHLEKLSPHIAVFTTFYPDHLNYYHHDMKRYLADKAAIFLYQKPEDTCVVGEQALPILKEHYANSIKAHLIEAHAFDVPATVKLRIPGEHNRLNAACAMAAARALGCSEETILQALEAFNGVPGRLEFQREIDGISYYNDTTATTPEATIAALQALDPENEKNIILIAGGADKDLDMSALIPEIHTHAKALILLAGTGTHKIQTNQKLPEYSTLLEALSAAGEAANKGDIILFSPAFASFGMFKNEYDRGEQFSQLVKTLL